MKNMTTSKKRTLSLLLTLTLIITSFGFTNMSYAADNIYTPYADALNMLGVFEGTDQGYELDRAPTRLEGLILFIKMLGEQDQLLSIQTLTTAFDDVPAWGSAFAEYAHAKGYTSGIAPRQFGSMNDIQANSYMTYLLRALGYEISAGDFNWATAIEDAVQLGVINTQDAKTLNEESFTRGHVAYLSYKTLSTNLKSSDQTLFEKLESMDVFTSELPVMEAEANILSFDLGNSKRRELEIINAFDEIDITVSSASYFVESPILEAPYKAGKLTSDLITSGIDVVGFIRNLAYLSEDVTDDLTWNDFAQHAALSNFVNDTLGHSPARPVGMSDELYEKAYEGAQTSNLYYGMRRAGQLELRNSIISYMDDSDNYNIDKIGHRRWLLYPNLTKVGIGYVTDGVTTYSALKVFDQVDFDSDIKDSADFVAWPSESAFPTKFFESHMPWSVSPNPDVYDSTKINEIEVTLRNETSGMESTFKQDELRLKTKGTQKFYNIDIQGYGVPFCIIFRPDDYQLNDEDVYTVTISGLYKLDGSKTKITYQTRFFNM